MQGIFSFEFQPLRAGETFGRLTLHNSDLGYYLYELNLKATPALPEKPIHFQTTLGSGQSIFAKFTNYTRQKTEYYCRVSSRCPLLCPSLARSRSLKIIGGYRGCRNVKLGGSQVLHPAEKLPARNKQNQAWVLPYRLYLNKLGWGQFCFPQHAQWSPKETVVLSGHV